MVGKKNALPADGSGPAGSKRELDDVHNNEEDPENNAHHDSFMALDDVSPRRQPYSVPTVLTPAARRAIYQLPCNDWLVEPLRQEISAVSEEVWDARHSMQDAHESFRQARDRGDSIARQVRQAHQHKLSLDDALKESEESADRGARRALDAAEAVTSVEDNFTHAIVSFAQEFLDSLSRGPPSKCVSSAVTSDNETPAPAAPSSQPEQQGESHKKRRKKTLPGKSETSVILAMRLEKVVTLEAALSRAVNTQRQAQANLERAMTEVLDTRVLRREAIEEVANLELQEVQNANDAASSQARAMKSRVDWDIAKRTLNKARDEYHSLIGVMLD